MKSTVKETEEMLGGKEMRHQANSISEEKMEIGTYHVNLLIGILLTVIDATFQDREQRKAMKTIIKSRVWDWFYKESGNGSTYSVVNEATHHSDGELN